jgi:hypothetical protein
VGRCWPSWSSWLGHRRSVGSWTSSWNTCRCWISWR